MLCHKIYSIVDNLSDEVKNKNAEGPTPHTLKTHWRECVKKKRKKSER